MAVHQPLSPEQPQLTIPPTVAIVAPAVSADRLEGALVAGGLPVVARSDALDSLGPIDNPAAVVVGLLDLEEELEQLAQSRRSRFPHARLVVVTESASPRTLRALFAEGVDALVLEADVDRCLALSVRSACAGQVSLPRSLRSTLGRPVLSVREKQVLGMVVLGLTNGEIAHKLRLSESTVKSHLSSSFTKLGVRSRGEAAALILDPAAGLGTGILVISED